MAFERKILGNTMKTCWFVAGPNGAGKSTLAKKYLRPECVEFVNFD